MKSPDEKRRDPRVSDRVIVRSAQGAGDLETINLSAGLGVAARDVESGLKALLGDLAGDRKMILHRPDAMEASISSGSFPVDGMAVVPCSGGTLAAIANGTSTNLLQRAAEVTLKEHRPLVLALRETPLSLVHIENMRRAALAGAILYPLMPAFYTGPQS